MSFKNYFKIEEETTAGDIAAVDNKLDMSKRPSGKPCKKHDKVNCKECKGTKGKNINEANEIEKILRDGGIKIKHVNNARFSTDVELFKKPDEDELQDLLQDYDFEIDGKHIYIKK